MRKLALLITLMMAVAGSSFAQSAAFQEFFNKYKDDDRFTKVSISSKMFDLFTEFESQNSDEEKMVKSITSKLDGLKMLVAEKLEDAVTVYKSVVEAPGGGLEELMTVEKEGVEFTFFITESGGTITELLMVAYDKDKFMLMSIFGDINLKEISKLSRHMNIDGFEHLENVGSR